MSTTEKNIKAIQVKKPKNIVQIAEKIGGKYFASLARIKFKNLQDIAYLSTDSNHPEDEPRQAYFQGNRISLKKARRIKLDLEACEVYFCLQSGFVRASRGDEIKEAHDYDLILREEIQRRIRLYPELASLLRVVQH